MAEEEVGLRLSLKNRREVARGVHQVGDELDRVGDQAAQANRQSRIAARGIAGLGRAGKMAGRVAVLGIAAITGAVVAAGYAATKLVKSSLSEAREAQKVSAVTRAEIKATGGVANVTARSMSRLANAISRKAGMDDEAIQSGANLLLTFKNVRNEAGKGNKIFDQATQAAVDLSAAGFGSIESGSKMLGKALNDPIKGITALSRAGVTFSEEQVKRIGHFVEENDLLSAQKIILGEVQSQVGGVAAAQATWGDKAKVLWGNLQERVGMALLPLLDRFGEWFVKEGGPKVDHFIGLFIHKGIPAIEDFARKSVDKFQAIRAKVEPLARELLPEVWGAVKKVAHWAGVGADKATDLVKAFKDMPEWAKTLLIAGGAGAWLTSKIPGVNALGAKALGSLGKYGGATPVYVTNPGFGGGAGGVGGKVPPVAAVGGGTVLSSLGLASIPLFGGLAAAHFTPVEDRNQASSASGGYAGDGGMSLSNNSLNDLRSQSERDANIQAALAANAAKMANAGKGVEAFRAILDRGSEATDRMNGRFRQMMINAGLATTEVKGVTHGLGDLASQHPEPRVRVTGIPESRRDVDDFIRGPLHNVEQPRTAHVGADTSAAVAKVDYLGRMIAGLSRTVSVDLTPRGFGGGLATGGPAKAGMTYLVGERGPELLQLGVNGYVHPNSDLPRTQFAAPTLPEMPRYEDETWGDPGPAREIHVHLEVDRRELGTVVVDDFDDRMARA